MVFCLGSGKGGGTNLQHWHHTMYKINVYTLEFNENSTYVKKQIILLGIFGGIKTYFEQL